MLDKQLDSLYDYCDSLMRNNEIEMLDNFVKSYIDVEHLDILLGVLTATLPVKSRLKNREQLLYRAIKLSIEQKEYTDDLFRGLS